ncbi:MAG TPA: dihydrolipoyl dehydrogenase [Methylomirabilota bacterium]|nr:dihydrolipoyl dehydrogenase [Methylomirabilota bacterium]
MADRTGLAVVGGGPGGYAAAFRAADLGLEVTLIDPEPDPGGVCLYRGCIPSKALLHVAKVISAAHRAGDWGVRFADPEIDLDRLGQWKDEVVERLTGGLGKLADSRGLEHLRGTARFADAAHLDVTTPDGDHRRLAFDHAIVATGSEPVRLPGQPDSDRVWDSRRALELPFLPSRLVVVGGGYIGLEMGSVYAALGSEVTVVEMTDSLLPGVDADLVRPLTKSLEARFERIFTGATVDEIEPGDDRVRVAISGEGGRRDLHCDAVLVAVGRRPFVRGLGLDRTAVRFTETGFIAVDGQRRTAEPAIFAVGDAAGEPMLAHKASHEGRVAAEAAAGRRSLWDPRAIPAVVYTDPEVAWCGLTEAEAEASGREIRITRFPWAASGRAVTTGAPHGVTKLVTDPASGRVLGVGITGEEAGELIAEAVLAVEMGAVAEDLARSIHPHPTRSETLMEAAEMVGGQATHTLRKRSG